MLIPIHKLLIMSVVSGNWTQLDVLSDLNIYLHCFDVYYCMDSMKLMPYLTLYIGHLHVIRLQIDSMSSVICTGSFFFANENIFFVHVILLCWSFT
jgi:hypothetical protein